MSRWFRFYDCALDDPKVQRLPGDLFKAWINLLCVASRHQGRLPGAEDLAFIMRSDVETLKRVISELSRLGLLDPVEGGFEPHNWAELQYQSDSSAERMRRHRAAKRTSDVTDVTTSDVTGDEKVTVQNRTEQNRAEEISAPARSKKGTRLPEDWKPNPDLIATATTLGLSAAQFDREIEKFRDYWAGRAGAAGVKLDWDATARNWMRSAAERINPAPRNSPSPKQTPAMGVWINRGSPQWQAWTKAKGREPYWTSHAGNEGAFFRTEWPTAEGVAA